MFVAFYFSACTFGLRTQFDTNVGEDPTVGLDEMLDTEEQVENTDPTDTSNGNPDSSGVDQDGDGVPVEDDCDDLDASSYPGAVDIPNDGIDQDCDNQDVYVAQTLNNAGFDTTANGRVANWLQLGGSSTWQGDGTDIRTNGQNSGAIFYSRTSGGGSLKVWGDYGNNAFSPGESNVFQEFISTRSWNPDGKDFWFEGWVMIHSIDQLQASAEAFLAIRCLSSNLGDWSINNEYRSSSLASDSAIDQWVYLSTSGVCDDGTETVQAMIVFSQANSNTDHGTVYFEDMLFGEMQ